MNPTRSSVVRAVCLLAFLGSSTSRISAQTPVQTPGPAKKTATQPPNDGKAHKSAYGKLESVVVSQNGVIMRTDAGERVAWKFDAAIIAELSKFKPGDPMIVIYRQVSPSEKRVTAVAFPGAAKAPTYINMTGWKVSIRSVAALEGGVCSQVPDDRSVTELSIAVGGRAEVLEGCWCCAPDGESCTPSNKSGIGQAFLVRCFQ